MNSLIIVAASFGAFFLAYKFYAAFLGRQIFALNPGARTPAHEFEDGIDYVPAKKFILFGHHFTSIAGAAPIVGPAIAVIWGWLPALLWVVLGTIFIGEVQKYFQFVETPRVNPWHLLHNTSFARCPLGKVTFTHGHARGTLPYGLLDNWCCERKIKVKLFEAFREVGQILEKELYG